MGPRSDPESPDLISQAPTRTCRALDWAFGTVLLLLAGILAAFTVLRANPVHPRSPEGLSAPRLSTQGPYAHLVMENALVQNQTLSWYSNPSLSGVLLDSQMNYDADKQELEVQVAGLYFVYAHLKLKQVLVQPYSKGIVKVSVSVIRGARHRAVLTLSLDVEPSSTSIATTSQSSLIFLYPGEGLRFNMSTTEGDFLDWQLDSGASTFGLFWVAGGQPLTESGAYLL